MKFLYSITVFLAAATVAAQASAEVCEAAMRPQIEEALSAATLEASLTTYLAPLLAKPRYFEGGQAGSCSRPQLDHPLYPGIPVKACAYEHLGLKGWVMLANPGASLASKWITNACSGGQDAKACMVGLTAYTWCSNQLSFPVAGNIIEPASLSDARGVNTVVLHGVNIQRPPWLAERTSVDAETQKQKFTALAASEHVYKGQIYAVSRPSGIRPEIYSQYAEHTPKTATPVDIGVSCPASARNLAWLDISRTSYNEAWRSGRNRLFDAAAKALMAGVFPGPVACK